MVTSELQVRWSDANKPIQWEADGKKPYRNLQTDSVFLTKRSIYVTYPRMNPLRLQATATLKPADDPSYAVLTKLIDAISTVATTVRPAAPVAPAAPAAPAAGCSNPAGDFNRLYDLLYGGEFSPERLTGSVKTWTESIDNAFAAKKGGHDAIAAGTAAIRTSARQYETAFEGANKLWQEIRQCAAGGGNPLYSAVSLIDIEVRLGRIKALTKAAEDLAQQLDKQFGAADRWTGIDDSDFILSDEVFPTFDKMQAVTLKVTKVEVQVDPATKALVVDKQDARSASFTVRKYSSFAPEIGAGAVFGTVKQPEYGTGTNAAGQTIVTRIEDTSLSVNPTILANFVCRCGMGLLAPMFQIGGSRRERDNIALTGARSRAAHLCFPRPWNAAYRRARQQ